MMALMNKGAILRIAAMIAIAVVSCSSTLQNEGKEKQPTIPIKNDGAGPLSLGADISALVENIKPSVVRIEQGGTSGSGFIVRDGVVIANCHVAKGAGMPASRSSQTTKISSGT